MTAARAINSTNDLHLPETEGETLFQGIVYGPFELPGFGKVLGINVLGEGQKACSFDCPYCDLGRTQVRLNKLKVDIALPSLEEVCGAITEAFKRIHLEGPAVDGICFSGNGEPTLHPDFVEIVKATLASRDMWMPGKPVSVLTNGSTLDSRKIVDTLNTLDERIVKLDAGSEKLFKIVNAPLSRTSLSRILQGIGKLKDVTIQSLFFEGLIDNTQNADLEEWFEVIAIIRPKAVQIHGLRRPASVQELRRCEEDTLYAIASKLERRIHMRPLVFP
jgi:wyosine [tRNA(Phe)-imidazoG37] synthetase (radical SAM superfamily)